MLPSLAAAAHGSIFLQLLPRLAPRSAAAAAMFGTLARELARPSTALSWFEGEHDAAPPQSGSAAALGEALAATPVLGPAASTSIEPTMRQAEDTGLAAGLIGPVLDGIDVADATRAIVRVSTESMLRDDPAKAPYGWSHCLTMPLAACSVAAHVDDARTALAVAATHVVGFRTSLGAAPLVELRTRPTAAPVAGLDGLDEDPERVAATALGADPARRARLVQRAVDLAATHRDAHLAKYVLACLDTARLDPQGAPQHEAAAVKLAAWWTAQDARSTASA